MADGHIYKGRRIIAKRIGVHHQVIKEGIGGAFVMILNHFLTKSTFLRRPGQQLLVVTLDAKIIRYHFTDFTACRTKLSSYCDNRIHKSCPFPFMTYLFTSIVAYTLQHILYPFYWKSLTNPQGFLTDFRVRAFL